MLATIGVTAGTLVASTSGASSSYPNTRGIQLYAPSTNTGIIYIGKTSSVAASGALTTGLPVEAGKAVLVPPDYALDANALYIISDTASQGLIWDLVKS